MYPDSPEIRQRVIAEAKTWLGTPFLHHASSKGEGVACGPLLIEVYGAVGIKVPRLADLGYFPQDWHLHCADERYLEIIKHFTREVSEPKPADIVLLKIGRAYGHSAIVVNWPSVIHVMWRSKVEYAIVGQPPLIHRRVNKPIFLSPFE
jgi:cell wall-associated NlpC family hydrolase